MPVLVSPNRICAQVDLILHPLRSELNFPIGAREPLDSAPKRWLLPLHLLDGLFQANAPPAPSVPSRGAAAHTATQKARHIIAQLQEALAEGYGLRFLQSTPHLVLLNEASALPRPYAFALTPAHPPSATRGHACGIGVPVARPVAQKRWRCGQCMPSHRVRPRARGAGRPVHTGDEPNGRNSHGAKRKIGPITQLMRGAWVLG